MITNIYIGYTYVSEERCTWQWFSSQINIAWYPFLIHIINLRIIYSEGSVIVNFNLNFGTPPEDLITANMELQLLIEELGTNDKYPVGVETATIIIEGCKLNVCRFVGILIQWIGFGIY